MSGTRAVSFLGPGEIDSGAALTDPESGAGAGAGEMTGFGKGAEEASAEANGDGGTGGLGVSRGWGGSLFGD
jgi:hypothetical protein